MNVIVVVLALFVAALAAAKSPDESQVWFVWLVRGDGPRPTDESERTKMQEAHLANFRKLHADGKLIAAGPVTDPTQQKRGIVVVLASDLNQVMGYFEADPYIQKGIMTVQASRWTADQKALKSGKPDPVAMDEHRIVILANRVKGGVARARYPVRHSSPGPRWSGRLLDTNPGEEVWVFFGNDEKAIRAYLQEEPDVRSDRMTVTIIPLYMSKGVLTKPKE